MSMRRDNPSAPHRTYRIEVRFDLLEEHSTIVLEYAGSGGEITRFAEAMVADGRRVTVDTEVRDDIASLPCRRLWEGD